MPDVSIIIPMFNCEKYIEKCIKSVIAQTYKNIEIILVDDGSTDHTFSICKKYATLDNRVKLIYQKNKGVSSARNTGIKNAQGKWIMFVDSDDWIDDIAVEILYNTLDLRCDLVVGLHTWDFNGTSKISSSLCNQILKFDLKKNKIPILGTCLVRPADASEWFPDEMAALPMLSVPVAKLYRKEIIIKNHLYFPEDIKIGEDKIFNLCYINSIRSVYVVGTSIYHYIIRSDSASNSQIHFARAEYTSFLRKLYHLAHDCIAEKNIYPYINYSCIRLIIELGQRYGMAIQNWNDFIYLSTQIKEFISQEECFSALSNMSILSIPGKREQIMTFLYKHSFVKIALIICFLYYKIFPQRNRFKT